LTIKKINHILIVSIEKSNLLEGASNNFVVGAPEFFIILKHLRKTSKKSPKTSPILT
jgi:hypothetical protein